MYSINYLIIYSVRPGEKNVIAQPAANPKPKSKSTEKKKSNSDLDNSDANADVDGDGGCVGCPKDVRCGYCNGTRWCDDCIGERGCGGCGASAMCVDCEPSEESHLGIPFPDFMQCLEILCICREGVMETEREVSCDVCCEFVCLGRIEGARCRL